MLVEIINTEIIKPIVKSIVPFYRLDSAVCSLGTFTMAYCGPV